MDIGGDKQAAYFGLPGGAKSILRLQSHTHLHRGRKDIFITQLKAILRSGIFGNVKVGMFPMISNVRELRTAKHILRRSKRRIA